MILDGSTITSTTHARHMADHLFKDENEHILPKETLGLDQSRRGFENDLVQMHLYTRMTKGKTGVFHVAINPREYESLTPEQQDRALQIIEQEFGLTGQVRMQVDHIKEGRAHMHVFWSTVDQDKGKLIDLKFYKYRLQKCAESLEQEFGHEKTIRTTNERTYELTNAERMTEKRTGRKAMQTKEEVTAIWEGSTSGQDFLEGLRNQGYEIAKGDSCRFALIDPKGRVCNLVRQLPKTIKTKHVRERLGDLERDLPGVEMAKTLWADKHSRTQPPDKTRLKEKNAPATGGDKQTRQLYAGLSAEEAIQRGLNHFLERQSTVAESRLVSHVMSHSPFTKEDITRALKSKKDLIRGYKDEVQYLTTREAIQEENNLIEAVEKGQGRYFPLNNRYQIKQPYLNEGQKGAIRHVLYSNDQVILVSGGAGVGKTSLMQEVKEGIEERGKTLHAFAPSANASRGVLQDKGFEGADTIASLLQSRKKQEQVKGGVILIDEAGMVGNKTMNTILKIAEDQKARVILSGDWRQHNSPEAGDALRIIEQRSRLKVGRVSEIVRQKNTAYKEAVSDLSKGQTDQAFEKLDKMGAITEIIDDQTRYEQAAKDYLNSIRQGRTALVVSPTHAEGKKVSDVIRRTLKEEGEIDQDEKTFTTYERLSLTQDQMRSPQSYSRGMSVQFHAPAGGFERGAFYDVMGLKEDKAVLVRSEKGKYYTLPLKDSGQFQVFYKQDIQIAKGDQVRITANGQTIEGQSINNGECHKVKGFDKDGNIQLSNGTSVNKTYGNIALGYYSTSHASQGQDAQDVYIVQSSRSFIASSDKQFYVSASRGEESIKIYTDDKEGLKQAVKRSGDRMTAMEVAEQSPVFVFNQEAQKKLPENTDNVIDFEEARKKHLEQEQSSKPSKGSPQVEEFNEKAQRLEQIKENLQKKLRGRDKPPPDHGHHLKR